MGGGGALWCHPLVENKKYEGQKKNGNKRRNK